MIDVKRMFQQLHEEKVSELIRTRTAVALVFGTYRYPARRLLMKNDRLFVLMVIAVGLLPVIRVLGMFVG